MKIDCEQNIVSLNEETLDIYISFNPGNAEEEKLAAMIYTIVDLVKGYHRLNTLVDDDGTYGPYT